MTIQGDEYRRLLRCTLIATALCIAAVLVCYFWIDRPVAFFVYRHHINTIRVFRWLTYPPPEVQNWSALVLDDFSGSTGVGTISALAEGAACRVSQLDRCRCFPHLVR